MNKFSIRDHSLHEEPPTIECLVADVHYADEQNELQLIDSHSSKPDGISEHSAKNLLNCIESVANKSFDSASRSVHYAWWAPNIPVYSSVRSHLNFSELRRDYRLVLIQIWSVNSTAELLAGRLASH